MADPRPTVVREAGRLLATGAMRLTAAELLSLMVEPPHGYTCARALRLVPKLPKFVGLETLLTAAPRVPVSDLPLVEAQLEEWYIHACCASYAVRADEHERERLLSALRGGPFEAAWHRRIEDALR